jgi:hypothetical protein
MEHLGNRKEILGIQKEIKALTITKFEDFSRKENVTYLPGRKTK